MLRYQSTAIEDMVADALRVGSPKKKIVKKARLWEKDGEKDQNLGCSKNLFVGQRAGFGGGTESDN